MAAPFRSPRTYRFGNFEFDPCDGELRKFGHRIRLQPQHARVLQLLLEHAGEVVKRDELRQQVWPENVFVDFDHALNKAVNRLREVLGDSPASPRFIETLPRLGYRFTAEVQCEPAATNEIALVPQPAAEEKSAALAELTAAPAAGEPESRVVALRPASRKRGLLALAAVALAAVLGLAALLGWRAVSPRYVLGPTDWILVADFANHTGERELDDVLDFALQSELSNSRYVHVAAPERIQDVLRFMRKPPDTPIDEQTGREICLRDGGIRALVTGRIEKLDGGYVIAVAVVDPQTGATLRSFRTDARSRQEVLPALNRLSNRLREEMGEAVTDIRRTNRQLEKVTTPSLAALQAFSRGYDLLVRDLISQQTGNLPLAASLLQQAVAADPKFASAYAYLGLTQISDRDRPSGIANLRQAVQLADTASERERLLILQLWYMQNLAEGDVDKATQHGALLTQLYPDFYLGVSNQADLLVRAQRYDEAAAMYRRALALRPGDVGVAVQAWQDLRGTAAAEQFLQAIKEIGSRRGDPAAEFWVPYIEADERWRAGDVAGAAAALGRARTDDPYFAHLAAIAYLSLGKLQQAEQLAPAASVPGHVYSLAAFLRGGIAGLKSYAMANPAEKEMPGGIETLLYARVGRLGSAKSVIRAELPLKPVAERSHWPWAIAGEEELNAGAYGAAVKHLTEALKWPMSGAQRNWVANSLAVALEHTGDEKAAIAILERPAVDRPEILQPLLLAHLARLYQRTGDAGKAAAIEARLKAMRAVADEDYSLDAQLADCPLPPPSRKLARK